MSGLRKNTYFLPGEGIERAVIQADICKYLDNDATVRKGEYEGRQGYFIYAYRNLTDAMLQDLKADSAKWRADQEDKQRRNTGHGDSRNNPRGSNPQSNSYDQSWIHAHRQQQPNYPINLEDPSPYGGPIDLSHVGSRPSHGGGDQPPYPGQQSTSARFTPPISGGSGFQAPYGDHYGSSGAPGASAPMNTSVPRSSLPDYSHGPGDYGHNYPMQNQPADPSGRGGQPPFYPNHNLRASQPPPSAAPGRPGAYGPQQPPPHVPHVPASAPPMSSSRIGGGGYDSAAPGNSSKRPRMDDSNLSNSRADYRSADGSNSYR